MNTKIRLSLLSFWFGITALFSFVVAPAAFKVLPNTWLAGNVVNRVLGVTEIMGIVIGLSLLALLLAAKPARRALWFEAVTLLLMTFTMVLSRFAVSSSMHALREKYGETLATFPATHPERVTFAQLHGFSEMLMGLNLLATLVLIIYLMRRQAAPDTLAQPQPAAVTGGQHA